MGLDAEKPFVKNVKKFEECKVWMLQKSTNISPLAILHPPGYLSMLKFFTLFLLIFVQKSDSRLV